MADLSILRWMREHPAQIGRWCGFDKLTDDLHGEWMKQMISGQGDMTLLSHRGSFKTTCLSVALGILLATDPYGNNIFMRKSESDVVEIVTQVAKLILSPPFQELTRRAYGDDYGPIRLTQASGTIVNTDVNAAAKGAPQLLGIGTSGSMTGKHADRVFTDDIVNLQDRASKAERQRICRIYMELQNIRNPGGRIINTGTPWHKEDAISTLMPNIQRYDYHATGLLTAEKLEELKKSMEPSLFAANYELKHIAAENALFPHYPEMTDDADWLRDGIAHIDAAYGGEDYTALTCAARVGDKIYLYGRMWRGHVDTVLDAALYDCDRLMCGPIYCETNGDKGYLAKEIRSRGGSAHPYAEKQNKYIKISSYLKKWWENIVVLEGTDQMYLDQIMNYTEDAEHDDAADSAACCCRILDRRE